MVPPVAFLLPLFLLIPQVYTAGKRGPLNMRIGVILVDCSFTLRVRSRMQRPIVAGLTFGAM